MITPEQIKELRELTGISIAQCKKALEDAGGDMAKALEALRAKGAEIAEKKADRDLGAGVISAYIHGAGTVGTLVKIQCETDFVAKNPEFKGMADDLAMHAAAMMPADTAEFLSQPFIKDPSLTVQDIIKNSIQKFGERVELVEFVRFDLAAKNC